MNTTLKIILQGIAHDAIAANDQDTLAVLQQFYQDIIYAAGTAYDSATTSTTEYLQHAPAPYAKAGVNGSYDTQQEMASIAGTPNIKLFGG